MERANAGIGSRLFQVDLADLAGGGHGQFAPELDVPRDLEIL
jgi:hypothetical protein